MDETSRREKRPLEWSVEALLDEMAEGCIVLDPAWRITRMNRHVAEYLQRHSPKSPRNPVGMCLWEAFPSIRGTFVEALYRHAALSGEPLETEFFSPLASCWLAVRVRPSERGLAIFFRELASPPQDAEELRASEAGPQKVPDRQHLSRLQEETLAELRATEARLRLTLDSAPIGMALIGLDGRWIQVNQRVCEIVGYSAAELTELTFQDVTHPDDLEKDLSLVGALLRGEITRYELPKRYIRKDGAIVDILLSASLLRDELGAPRMFISQIQDLREKKRLEAQLALADRMASIGTLASGVAHEINNPLAYAMLNLQLIGDQLRSRAGVEPASWLRELLALVDDARGGAERVRKIVRGLKAFARADTPRSVPLDVEVALEVAINMTANEIRHHARLVKDYGRTPRVAADEAQLGQVFINLLVNAAQSIPEGNTVENEIYVGTRTDGEGRAVIEIRDTGSGIPRHLLQRIFDPFFTTKEIGMGTGLGLSVSHGIVASLGGMIEVESEVGEGTCFRIVLPPCASDLEAQLPARASDADASSGNARVLVIDDETTVGETLGRGLEEDHLTTVVSSGREALTIIEAGERFDVILCDVMMPDVAGPDLHQRLQRFAPEQAARMIFMTGGAFTPATRAFLEGITNPTLEKPFELQALRALVRAVVGRS